MQIKIYVDVLFCINLVMDYFLLALTALLLRLRQRSMRFLLGALPGAGYALAAFFVPLPLLLSFGAKLAVSAVMVLFAFGFCGKRAFCRNFCAFFLVSLACGGIGFALMTFTGLGSRFGAVCSGGVWYADISVFQLLPAAVLLTVVLRTAFAAANKAADKAGCLLRVTVGFEDRSLSLRALYDTGNFLTDSKGRGVLLAQWDAVAPLFPNFSAPCEAALAYPEQFALLNCSGIGGRETLPAFFAQIRLFDEQNTCTRLIAVTDRKLDRENAYHLILPIDLEGAKQNDGKFIKRHSHTGKISVPIFEKLSLRAGGQRRGVLHRRRRGTSRSADTGGGGNAAQRADSGKL